MSIESLIAALDTDDAREQRRIGDRLRAEGRSAIPALLGAMQHPSPRIRRAVAFVLGTQARAPEVRTALETALAEDDDPKVRKNVAVVLGEFGTDSSRAALLAALDRETVAWVRASCILALGAIGGDGVYERLSMLTPENDDEHQALQKALDRTAPRRADLTWQRDAQRLPPLMLEVLRGLEAVAQEEAQSYGLHLTPDVPGLMRIAPSAGMLDPLPHLRCVVGPLALIAEGPPLPLDDLRAADAMLTSLLDVDWLRHWRTWLTSPEPVLRFRFTLLQQVRRETHRALLEVLRAALQPFGLVDSPSNYAAELILDAPYEGTRVLLRPSFADQRFAYREQDVPAALNPVVAAGLARLVRTGEHALCFDPVCGSATLLIERARLDPTVRAQGVDSNLQAVAAAHANLRAAGLPQVRVVRGDARDLADWPECDEVLANLPFGLRTRNAADDPATLYPTLLANLEATLRPGGRAVLYSAQREILDAAIARRKRLRTRRELQVRAGGMLVHVRVVVK